MPCRRYPGSSIEPSLPARGGIVTPRHEPTFVGLQRAFYEMLNTSNATRPMPVNSAASATESYSSQCQYVSMMTPTVTPFLDGVREYVGRLTLICEAITKRCFPGIRRSGHAAPLLLWGVRRPGVARVPPCEPTARASVCGGPRTYDRRCGQLAGLLCPGARFFY